MIQVDRAELEALEKEGLVGLARHAELPLTLANYTNKAQFDRAWSVHPILLDCRGLIFDDDGRVVAKPFRKFFNLGEPGYTRSDIPPEPPEVSEKLDGSLAITYPVGNSLRIATRGSFDSTQAHWATHFMAKHHGGRFFDASLTYLFEILFPENRIVVNYGSREELVLIGAVQLDDGRELSYAEVQAEAKRLTVPTVTTIHDADWATLASTSQRNFEGYVLFWPRTQQRVKIKLPDYVELHRLVTDFSAKRVWAAIRDGAFERLLADAPDEVFGWARTIQGELQQKFEALQDRVEIAALDAKRGFPTRREQAQWILAHHHDISAPVFKALDERPYAVMLWQMLEPPPEAGRFAWHVEDGE
jgi:RNA ligase